MVDAALVDWILREFASRNNVSHCITPSDWHLLTDSLTHWLAPQGLDLSDDRLALGRLREAAERAKVELASLKQTAIR